MGRDRYKQVLEDRWQCFNADGFIKADPLNIVYQLKERLFQSCECNTQQHLEIGALFVAMIAWGNRKMIQSNAVKLMHVMNWLPYNYIVDGEFENFPNEQCVHRTLFGKEFKQVCRNLQQVYTQYSTLQEYVLDTDFPGNKGGYVEQLAKIVAPAKLGSVSANSACKRICMYLRWMVRSDKPDLGLWQQIAANELFAVLDVHVVRQAQMYGLVTGKTASWRAVQQLTDCYKLWCQTDPLKYDMVMMQNDIE